VPSPSPAISQAATRRPADSEPCGDWPAPCYGRPPVALVADDEPLVRQLVRTVLIRHGWHVIEAHNGASALMLGLDEKIDLLVTDCQMPELSGLELAGHLRDVDPHLPVLVISGLPGVDTDARVRGYEFMGKPFPVTEFVSRVDRLTRRVRSL
jgi:two-component system, OmpR family, response regulator